jgi:EamA-like transporter family
LFLAIFGTVAAYTIYLRLVRDWGAPRAGLYSFVSPIVALTIGWILFGEPVGWREVGGAAIMLAAASLALKHGTSEWSVGHQRNYPRSRRPERSEALRNSVSLQVAKDLPLIQGDRVQLQQVMLNLIINAVEAMSGVSERSRAPGIGNGSLSFQKGLLGLKSWMDQHFACCLRGWNGRNPSDSCRKYPRATTHPPSQNQKSPSKWKSRRKAALETTRLADDTPHEHRSLLFAIIDGWYLTSRQEDKWQTQERRITFEWRETESIAHVFGPIRAADSE